MPRVHTQKARKDYPENGIKKGNIYYKWKTRPSGRGNGIIHRSAVRPTRSQLTGSPFLSQVFSWEDDTLGDIALCDDPADMRDDLVQEIRDLADEQEEKIQNMPEPLQYSPTGEMLQERYDELTAWADELEGVDFPDIVDEPTDEPTEPSESDYAMDTDEGKEEFESAMEDYDTELTDFEDSVNDYDEYINEKDSAIDDLTACGYNGP